MALVFLTFVAVNTPLKKKIPAWAPGVLQPSLILLESGDVCGENRILIFPSFINISLCSFGEFTFNFLLTFVNVFSLQL